MDNPLIIVRWVDICSAAGWEGMDEVDPIEVTSVGWKCYEDDKVLKIGTTIGEDGYYYGITALPKGCVLEVTDACPVSPATHKAELPKPYEPRRKDRPNPHRLIAPSTFR